MMVKNIGADNRYSYLPYYYIDETPKDKQGFSAVTFYPRLDGNYTWIDVEDYSNAQPYTDDDLYVPEENYEAVEYVISQFEWMGTDEQIIQQLIEYFQAEIPYTIRPGRTPRDEDFVNYFILENQKGYCAHYATTAVLVLRYMGIPARYVEGYAIDYNQITEGELVEGAQYEDYYEGYSELGKTALVEINVTDADAHAWVEVYDVQKGWHPVEVTPYATIEEEEQEDFWTMFADMYDDSEERGDDAISDVLGRNAAINKAIRNVVYGLGIVLALIISVFLCIKLGSNIKYFILFCRAGINDKLIFKYQRICRKLRKRDKEFRDMLNYRQQIEYLVDKKQSSKQGKAD
ncbi:MAG: transglutaminase domain-containing protein, partial [Lachnospiraceae bacterium]|nr:transglutaminase domain-containing protein [Lachnospiraceae bacterium]